jgi:hypothetical protein
LSNTLRITAEFTITTTTGGITTYQDTLFTPVTAFSREAFSTDIPVRIGIRTTKDSVSPGGHLAIELYVAEGNIDSLVALTKRGRFAFAATIRFVNQVVSLNDGQRLWRVRNTDTRNRLLRLGIPFTLTDTNYTESWLDSTLSGIDAPGKLQFRRDGVIKQFERDSVLARFTCTALSGDTAGTGIVIESIRFGIDTTLRFAGERRVFVEGLVGGSFTSRASRAGGVRLISTVKPVQTALLAAIKPNPVLDAAEIGYTLFTDTTVELVLTDVLGRVVKHLDAGRRGAGQYVGSAPLSDVAPGTYFLVLRTPAAILTERLEVRR